MRRLSFITASIIILIIIMISLLACERLINVPDTSNTFEVTRGDIIQTITTSGYIDSDEKHDYSLLFSGKVLQILKKGDVFRKNDILIKIDDSKQELLFAQAEENINIAKHSLALAKISYQQSLDANHIAIQIAETDAQQKELSLTNAYKSLENANNMAAKSIDSTRIALENAENFLAAAKSDLLVNDTLIEQYEGNVRSAESAYESVKAQGQSSKDTAGGAYEQSILNQSTTYWSNLSNMQNVISQIEVTAENIKQAETQIELSKINLELIKLDMDNSIIYAPYNGIVLNSSYKEGQNNNIGVNAISIISNDFIIRANVNEIEVVNLLVGQDVEIRLDAYYENVISGKVFNISPISSIINGEALCEIIVKPEQGNDPKLIYGFSADLAINTSAVANVLFVPTQAVYGKDGKSYVDFIVKKGVIEKKEVTIGKSNYDFIEIKSGLNEGDIISISPTR